ncbi:unnamed protein product [Phytophthora fragariaefolia]|uniref:Unnamed protein product n=1 Tax=Phytophthora fragariaefolia TaxID=1490495 RepID=A0A9W6X024_9STRA|nr:unnamed protein product [Phytophthora fragariaefolia]
MQSSSVGRISHQGYLSFAVHDLDISINRDHRTAPPRSGRTLDSGIGVMSAAPSTINSAMASAMRTLSLKTEPSTVRRDGPRMPAMYAAIQSAWDSLVGRQLGRTKSYRAGCLPFAMTGGLCPQLCWLHCSGFDGRLSSDELRTRTGSTAKAIGGGGFQSIHGDEGNTLITICRHFNSTSSY